MKSLKQVRAAARCNPGKEPMSERTEKLRRLLESCKGRIVVTGHDGADVDSAASCVLIGRLFARWHIPCDIALCAPDGQARRVMKEFGVDVSALEGTTKDDDCLILVDHHQTARPGCVIACVDHHPTAYPPDYPYVQIEDCGACAVMTMRLMKEADVPVTRQDERLAIAALYLDTIALKSAKIRKDEAAWGESEAKRLGLDENWLRQEGMGLMDMSLPAEQLALLGRKRFAYGEKIVLSSYVQTNAMTAEQLEEILAVLQKELAREQADLWVFLVHDPVRMRSIQVNLEPDGTRETIEYAYLASRGKDVMPRVERMMRAGTVGKDEG